MSMHDDGRLETSLAGTDWAQRGDAPIFVGPVQARAVPQVAASLLRMVGMPVQSSVVRFDAGSHTRLHTHDGDQILVVVEGRGHIGTPGRDTVVVAGDIVVIPAGTTHYHGASAGEPMAHLTTLFGGSTNVLDDQLEWPPSNKEHHDVR